MGRRRFLPFSLPGAVSLLVAVFLYLACLVEWERGLAGVRQHLTFFIMMWSVILGGMSGYGALDERWRKGEWPFRPE